MFCLTENILLEHFIKIPLNFNTWILFDSSQAHLHVWSHRVFHALKIFVWLSSGYCCQLADKVLIYALWHEIWQGLALSK